MSEIKIQTLYAREVLDSRGNPTVAVRATLTDGATAEAMVPSGASTGTHEALERRDGDESRFQGKGVLNAVASVNTELATELAGVDAYDQQQLDWAMIDIDGTENKSRLGANAILGVSLAVAHAAAASRKLPLYRHIYDTYHFEHELALPMPMMNILNGGMHAQNGLTIQEFMVVPSQPTFSERLRAGAEIFHTLKEVLHSRGLATGVGDEGGFAPDLQRNEDALALIQEAVERAGYTLGVNVHTALDPAASEFYKSNMYLFDGAPITTQELMNVYNEWITKYSIASIEDGFAEDDWDSWQAMTQQLGTKVMLVGDDLFVTNTDRLAQGIERNVANAILIKLNQIGTLTETIDAIQLAQKEGYHVVISHRSGETEDTTIADLSVGTGARYIKTGSLSRSERIAKYNRLLAIEEELSQAV